MLKQILALIGLTLSLSTNAAIVNASGKSGRNKLLYA